MALQLLFLMTLLLLGPHPAAQFDTEHAEHKLG
jgi:hypothetical protein